MSCVQAVAENEWRMTNDDDQALNFEASDPDDEIFRVEISSHRRRRVSKAATIVRILSSFEKRPRRIFHNHKRGKKNSSSREEVSRQINP